MELKQIKSSLKPKLQVDLICSIRIFNILEVILQTTFFFKKSQNAQTWIGDFTLIKLKQFTYVDCNRHSSFG